MRRFKNTSDVEIQAPTLGVSIMPGEEGDIDLPVDQPTPDGLTEVTGNGTSAPKLTVSPSSISGVQRPTIENPASPVKEG